MVKSKELRDAEVGYAYDWTRQRQNKIVADKETTKRVKKKIDKLSKKYKVLRHK